MQNPLAALKSKVRFNRHEFAGSFGDIGTDFPLVVGIILASGMDVASVLIMYGLMQILTGVIYGIPMPVQPLKAMATIIITQKLAGPIIWGGGLAIGLIVFILSITGLLTWIGRVVPKNVVRGIQLGLGLQLSTLALKDYLPSDGLTGYVLGSIAFLIIILLYNNKRFPAAPFVILLGLLFACCFKIDWANLSNVIGISLPQLYTPNKEDIWTGLLLLALPQLPLSVCNSILATKQTTKDFFPEKQLTEKKIGLTYSVMNLINPFFGGIPVCHGSGGMVGHYFFGARSGGSVVIYGLLYLTLGLFFSPGFSEVIKIFPKPILGIILMFEGIALMRLIGDIEKKELMITMIVGVIAVSLPYGYLVGMLMGILLNGLITKKIISQLDHA